MSRPVLPTARLAPSAQQQIEHFHPRVIDQIEATLAQHDVVVVGMAQNPHVRRARRALSQAGISHEYLEYGSYLSQWRPRLAIKLWSGWPTFPQVFVRGTLLGGATETETAIGDGTLRRMLSETAKPAGEVRT